MRSDKKSQSAHLVWWFWGTGDVPGILKWLQSEGKTYKKAHPGVSVTIVPQATTTLIGAFQTAASSKSGPTIATQWATLPTLTPVWEGDVTPVTSLVKKKTIATWLNTSENTYKKKLWAVPIYLLGTPFVWNKSLFKKAGLNPTNGPKTWGQFISDCAKLKAAGIVPIVSGDKTGAIGAWLLGLVGDQGLNSVKQIEELATGKYSLDSKAYRTGFGKIDQLIKRGYFNSNVSSITLTQAWQQFAQGKGAMTWATDGQTLAMQKVLPAGAEGVEKTPVWGRGKLAGYYDVTQSSDEFITSWAGNKPAAAAFLSWLKEPKQVNSFYSTLGAFPASKEFAASKVTDPLAKQLYTLDTGKRQVWTENFWPPQVTTNGVRPALETMFTGASVTATIKSIQQSFATWRQEQPTQLRYFTRWVKSQS
ncbi:MAG: extracellular solute-binding protein [Actinomycetota bacterium]|nr:extracellular solute-binding protein [Actinomycetota bacterium]